MRKSRKYAKTGMYHVVIRGVNKQNIFFDDDDRRLFLSLLRKYSERCGIKILAYCLMDNHVHLELEDQNLNISSFMQVLCSVYARLFNRKYDRIGHLFQDRFASETIDDETYMLTVFRYIIRNPLVAGISEIKNYPWSSYEYYKMQNTFVYKQKFLDLFKDCGRLYRFLESYSEDVCLEIELRPSEREQQNVGIIKKILKSDNPLIRPETSIVEIRGAIKKMKGAGLSIRTIARITGIGKHLVYVS